MGDVEKVAILGGGVGAMTAAWWLTETARENPDGTQYDITVYQMGWRLGGKCASGRNMTEGYGYRIEEHGIHIWMGFYANAFRMIQKVYKEMNRPRSKRLSTWEDAFKPLDLACNMSDSLLAWYPWLLYFPPNNGVPGSEPQFKIPCEYLELVPKKLRPFVNILLEWLTKLVDPDKPPEIKPNVPMDVEGTRSLISQLADKLDELNLAAIAREADAGHKHPLVGRLASEAHDLVGRLLDSVAPINEIVKWLTLLDIGIAIVRGVIKDQICGAGWGSIEGINWKTWLRQNGLHAQSEWCPCIKVIYELLFAFRDGIPDEEHADLSATWGTLGVLRMLFEYQGSVYWKMQAGMGDVVFGPLYEVLKKRGVKFEFFHRVTQVVPAQDGSSIDSIQIDVQATVKDGEYRPIFEVNDLPSCWPATPFYDQLVEGEYLKRLNIDLEQYDAPWPPAGRKTLQAGTDFDWVVFGLSLGAVKYVCPQLVAQKRTWQKMLDDVGTVRTQAFQLWLNQDIRELGWAPAVDGTNRGQRALMGGFVEPLDTWGDWSQVIDSEDWPPGLVKNISYFCGPAAKDTKVAQNALELLRFDYQWIWPSAYDETGEFRWDYLVDPNNATGVARFGSQFFRYNIEPTELYVQSFAGTTGSRLGQDTGYSNLCIAGDWNASPFAVGCVEGAVIGAMWGLKPITGDLPIVK